jgi:hypothetical protein
MKKYLMLFTASLLSACSEQEVYSPVPKTFEVSPTYTNAVLRTPNRRLLNPIPKEGEVCVHSLKGNCGPDIPVYTALFQRIETAIMDGTIAQMFQTDTEVIETFSLSQIALNDIQNGITTLMRVQDVFVIVYSGSSDPFNYPEYLND